VVRDPCSVTAMKTSRRHSRRTSLAEKPRLPAAFGSFPLCHSLSFLVPLLLEPAVNEGAHQGAGRDAAPEAVAAQAQIGLLFEPHGHRLVAQWAHRHPPAYTSPPLLAPPRQAPYVLDLGGAAYLETMYPSGPTRYGSQFSIILAVESSLPRREPARHSLRQLHHPLQRRSLLWRQTVLRPDLHLSHRVCQDGGEGLRAILLRGG
jgi:hypothetical protein